MILKGIVEFYLLVQIASQIAQHPPNGCLLELKQESGESDCLRCDEPRGWIQKTGSDLLSRQCVCENRSFRLVNGACCHATCQQCDQNQACIACGANSERSSADLTACACLSSFYFDAVAGTCEKCAPKCRECASVSIFCTRCEPGMNRIEAPLNGDCPCRPGFHETEKKEALCC